MENEKGKPVGFHDVCLDKVSKFGVMAVDSVILGGYYTARGARIAVEHVSTFTSRVSKAICALDWHTVLNRFAASRGRKVDLREYMRDRKSSSVLITVPLSDSLGSGAPGGSQQAVSQLGKVLSEALEQEEGDSLTILNLDNYFKMIE